MIRCMDANIEGSDTLEQMQISDFEVDQMGGIGRSCIETVQAGVYND